MHVFLSNLAHRQTDKHRQKYVPPPLSEVISDKFIVRPKGDSLTIAPSPFTLLVLAIILYFYYYFGVIFHLIFKRLTLL